MTIDPKQLEECRALVADLQTVRSSTRDIQRGKAIEALVAEVERLEESDATCRRMFDLTRHRIAERLGTDHGKSWSALESLAAEQTATIARMRALMREVEWNGWLEEDRQGCIFCGATQYGDGAHKPDCRLAAELEDDPPDAEVERARDRAWTMDYPGKKE